MSEEILKALMQLFAIIARQDEGVELNEIEYVEKFLTQQLNKEAVEEYRGLFMKHAGISSIEEVINKKESERKLVSVRDSVRVLGICRKINKKLNQGQKVVALVRLFELVNADRKFSEQRMAIINTVAEVFNISDDEFKSIETFVIKSKPTDLDNENILIIDDEELNCEQCKQIRSEELDGHVFILRIQSTSPDLYFLRYTGNQNVFLNGLALSNKRIYLFASGSSIRLPRGRPVYYSDVVAHYMADSTQLKISFNVNDISYRFPTGNLGLRDISLSENHGKLVGIMGASGAGKTTLLNVLCGMYKPSEGKVLINGIDMHNEPEKLEGVIGYIPQDDLLIEELTVFQNLYFSAKQCFKDKTEEEIEELVNKTLKNLGLFDRRELKVGSPLNKMISGGQRKRLNIALELIREPSILFVDEPTSGLSSRDSENVMDLLSELTLKGKLIFVVIHQPSSDIYKMFDKMVILDTGGYQIYYGNPVEGVMYFKRLDQQINADEGECPHCGNITPELIFNIVEAQVVDEFGQYTDIRKVSPPRWEEQYRHEITIEKYEDIAEDPPRSLNIPSWFSQFKIYTLRDVFSKIANKQYVTLTLIESPLLAFILSFIIRYIADPHSNVYIFYENENIPPYIFMSIVVALFLGLTVSAEEIFRDRKILKREAFLNLSRSSYLMSKVMILLGISALQAVLFVAIGNSILGIRQMWFEYWYILFATFSFANMLGLNISASFNSAVTIYILIPLLMIPQMALGGAMFSFDKLNRTIGSVDKIPFIAETMASRWAYEALVVHQFKDNEFEKIFFDMEKRASNADFKISHYFDNLENRVENIAKILNIKEEPEINFDDFVPGQEPVAKDNSVILDSLSDEDRESLQVDVALLKREFGKENKNIKKLANNMRSKLNINAYNAEIGDELRTFLEIAREELKIKSDDDDEEEPELPPGFWENSAYESNESEDIDTLNTDNEIEPEADTKSENKSGIIFDDINEENDNAVVFEKSDSEGTVESETNIDETEPEETHNQVENEVGEQLPEETQTLVLPYPEIEEEYTLKELESLVKSSANAFIGERPDDETLEIIKEDLKVLEKALANSVVLMDKHLKNILSNISNPEDYDHKYYLKFKAYIQKLKAYHSKVFQIFNSKKQRLIQYIEEQSEGWYTRQKFAYHNEAVSDHVKKVYEKNKILRFEDQLIQQIDPIYLDPVHYHYFDFRSHFYAPRKYFAGKYYDTFWFNSIIIWIMTISLYFTLYFDLLKKSLEFFGNVKTPAFVGKIKIKKWRSKKKQNKKTAVKTKKNKTKK